MEPTVPNINGEEDIFIIPEPTPPVNQQQKTCSHSVSSAGTQLIINKNMYDRNDFMKT